MGQDGSTSFTIDTSTFLNEIEQFLWGYEIGSNLGTPAYYTDTEPNFDGVLNFSPSDITKVGSGTDYTLTSKKNLIAVSICFRQTTTFIIN